MEDGIIILLFIFDIVLVFITGWIIIKTETLKEYMIAIDKRGYLLSDRVDKLNDKSNNVKIEPYIDKVPTNQWVTIPYITPSPDNLKVTCCEAEKIKDPKERLEYLYTGKKPEPKPVPIEERKF